VIHPDPDPRPLAGTRILELGQVISAPYAGLLLADLGAEVIKVEPPLVGDSARDPAVTAMKGSSATFVTFNHNKKSIALDLKDPAEYATLIELVRSADVFLTNTIPAVAQRLRIDPATLRPLNPRLITCSIRGFQDDDFRAGEPSYDLTHQALAGYMLLEGSPGDPPARVSIPLADLGAAHFAVNAILAALYARTRTGLGDDIRIPMYDAMLSLLTYTATLYLNTGKEPVRMGSAHEYTAPWQAVSAKDGALVVAVRSEKFWRRLCVAIGRPDLETDPRFADNRHRLANRQLMSDLLNEAFRADTVASWLARLRAAAVPVAPIRSVADALSEAVASGSDIIEVIDDPGAGPIRIVGNPIRFQAMSLSEPKPAPQLNGSAAELGITSAEVSS
jgi:crotonobetainyl-CoA:carnitine CoA-transferase CaiB-like acyl-CoA transferase